MVPTRNPDAILDCIPEGAGGAVGTGVVSFDEAGVSFDEAGVVGGAVYASASLSRSCSSGDAPLASDMTFPGLHPNANAATRSVRNVHKRWTSPPCTRM